MTLSLFIDFCKIPLLCLSLHCFPRFNRDFLSGHHLPLARALLQIVERGNGVLVQRHGKGAAIEARCVRDPAAH